MSQLFKPRANLVMALALVGGGFVLAAAFGLIYAFNHTTYATDERRPIEQPVPFSHAHHVGGLGIDCRYCHTSVEASSTAGMPATEVCMHCHRQLWVRAEVLAPVRESYERNIPIRWNRVHKLPEFTYFDHSIHVRKGIDCRTCHGDVTEMPLMWKSESLFMQWCLQCHRHPERATGEPVVTTLYDKQPARLLNCTICHR